MTANLTFAHKSAVFAGLDRMVFLLSVASAGMDLVRWEDLPPWWLTHIAGQLVLALSRELSEGVNWVLQFSMSLSTQVHMLPHKLAADFIQWVFPEC